MNDKVSEDVWKKKDLLSARQTSANVTSYVFEGKEVDSEAFLEYAEKIFQWLYQDQDSPKSNPAKELPKPTPEEKEVLDKIVEKLDLTRDEVYAKVLEYTEKVYKKRVYPKNIATIEKFLTWLKEKGK